MAPIVPLAEEGDNEGERGCLRRAEEIIAVVRLDAENRGSGREERSNTMKWQDRISIHPQVCHGRPCIKGTRVMVSVILANLGEGEAHEAIMAGYHVTEEDIRAAILFAADMADDQFLPLGQGAA
jgi:uncharacterized protein (DUF433 family)